MTERNGWLNPFKELSPAHRKEAARQRFQAAEARKKFERVREAYKELVNDPRYVTIRQELEQSLGEQLHLLVETSRACATCAPVAVRVDVLNDVVARPLHQLFLEAQRSRMEPVPELAE